MSTTFQPPDRDTFLSQESPNSNYGSTDTRLDVGSQSSGSAHFNLLYDFDLTSLPAGTTFTDATLSFYAYGLSGSGTHTLYARRVTQSWTETGATWNKYDGTNSWSSAGGDYTTTNQGTLTETASSPAWHSFTGIQDLIQDCFDNQSRHAIILIKEDAQSNIYYATYSGKYTDDTSLCPKLVVTYTLPASTGNFFAFF